MKKKLLLSVCNFLIPEIAQVIKNGNYPEVQLDSYQANCSSKALNQIAIPKIAAKSVTNSDIIVIGSYCYSNNYIEKQSINKLNVMQLAQCFEIILNLETVYYFMNQGNYIVTNGWLKSYKKNIQKWGFDKVTAKSFFHESLKSILLLDTKIPGDYMPNLIALSEYMGLPYQIIPVGLSHCKKYIDTVVLNWRNENEKKELTAKLSTISKQSADHQLIFNQLETLVLLTNETEIIQIAFQLINILFAPTKIVYKLFENNEYKSFDFIGFIVNNEITSENSFSIEIKHPGELFGIFEIEGIQFPQFINKYEEMGVVISQIFGMAIANARKYSELEHSKLLISEREAELQKSTLKLRELNATKDKFFSILAHDLRGPIGNFKLVSEMLHEEYDDFSEDERINFLRNMKDSSNNIYKLLENLLEWARSQSGNIIFEPREFNLNYVVNSIKKLMKLSLENKNIELINKLENEIDLIADPNLINTIIRNLLSNAIKFTPNGGKIEIGAVVIPSNDSKTSGNKINIYIKDNGVGMSEDKIKKLFKIEFNISTDGTNKEKGTGLGLILCKEFIEKHGGKIWVESEVGKGSTFYFSIPQSTKIF